MSAPSPRPAKNLDALMPVFDEYAHFLVNDPHTLADMLHRMSYAKLKRLPKAVADSVS